MHPVLAARGARDGGLRLIEGVGPDLAAEHRGGMAVHHPLQQGGGGTLARVAAEQGGMRSGEDAVQHLLEVGELRQGPAPRLRRHLPAHPQAGEAVGERLLLGLADQLQPGARSTAPRYSDLAERRAASDPRREAGRGQRPFEAPPVGAAALIEAALPGVQPGREESGHRGACLGGSFIDQADVEGVLQVGGAAAARRRGAHRKTCRMRGMSGKRLGRLLLRAARILLRRRFGRPFPTVAAAAAGVE